MLKKDELKGVFEVPEAKKIRTDELEETQIAGGSMGEAVARACLKIKNCTKHLFLSPFYSIIKKKGCSLC